MNDETNARPCACPYCDQQLAEPLPFCEACGKEIVTCPSCAAPLTPVQKICPSCGTRLT